MKLSIKFVLILGSILVLSHTRCIDAPISSQTYACDADRNLTVSESTDLFSNFDTTDGKLTFELQFRITGACSLLTPPYSIFVMTLPVSGTTKKIFDLKYEGSNGYKIYVEDASSAQTRATLSAGAHVPPKNLGWIRATFTWDISANTAVPTIYTSLGTSTTSAVTFSFASFALSDAMAFYFGSGVDSANPMLCEVKSLKLLYGTPVTDYQNNVGMGWAPALIGTYSLREQSGYTLSSTSDSLGTGYLGSSSATAEDTDATHLPALISEEDTANTPSERSQYAGLLFTAQTQYITLPSFSFEEQLSDVLGPSFSINFWLRLSSLPASSNLYLFSYCQADGTEIFTVQVKTTGQFEATVLGVSLAGKNTAGYLLTTNTWNIIHIDFGRMDFTAADIKPYYVTVTIDDAATLTGSITPGSNPTFDTDTDYIKMGALGIINNVRVFSPGAGFYDTPACDSTTCDFEAGLLATPVCVVPACASTCAACSDEAVTSCLACNSGFGLSAGGRCKDTAPLTCAVDQYEDESVNSCENCDSSCGSCSGPGQRECITCADSYDFIGPLCSPVDDLESWVKLLIVLGIAFVVITITYAVHIIGARRAKSPKGKFAPL